MPVNFNLFGRCVSIDVATWRLGFDAMAALPPFADTAQLAHAVRRHVERRVDALRWSPCGNRPLVVLVGEQPGCRTSAMVALAAMAMLRRQLQAKAMAPRPRLLLQMHGHSHGPSLASVFEARLHASRQLLDVRARTQGAQQLSALLDGLLHEGDTFSVMAELGLSAGFEPAGHTCEAEAMARGLIGGASTAVACVEARGFDLLYERLSPLVDVAGLCCSGQAGRADTDEVLRLRVPALLEGATPSILDFASRLQLLPAPNEAAGCAEGSEDETAEVTITAQGPAPVGRRNTCRAAGA